MSECKTIEISRELLGVYLGVIEGDWVEAGHELRALLAAPVVERQEPSTTTCTHPEGCTSCSWCGWKAEQATDISEACGRVGFISRSGLESALRGSTAMFRSSEVGAYTIPLYASPPAPVSVVLPSGSGIRALITKAARDADLTPGANYYTAAELAVCYCLDKVKELNK